MATRKSSLKIIPLGGLGEIGKNITAFEYGNSIIVVDCGLAFPEDEMLGIDLVIPDVSYLKKNVEKIKGIILTHGHEDHIGALPYVLKEISVPIYGTRLTIGLVENKLKEHNMLKSIERHCVSAGDTIELGPFKVELIRINHSIADSVALAIHTPLGIIIHSGD
ncbi:MAG TPA: ribonuclease J, partial [Defluviitaleaceae bacterium]|nr:ribonuclease J [Defluviitaleaceae bacterium]